MCDHQNDFSCNSSWSWWLISTTRTNVRLKRDGDFVNCRSKEGIILKRYYTDDQCLHCIVHIQAVVVLGMVIKSFKVVGAFFNYENDAASHIYTE